ncbi:hypothetical protein [Glutamicibacter sp. ZJUTW]|uniref:hypothetical protein n=1 Tax=Glutamicibacter sp. ZJUTW TaxID=1155384 RepID=UPI001AF010B9|nr:hypothetical protein [Glutamicibacter sp. ZJUTW]
MLGLVYAVPSMPPPITSSFRSRVKIVWTGANGDAFDLTNWRQGVFIKQDGIEGLGSPERQDWVSALSPFVHGQEYRGHTVIAREIFLPIYLYADGASQAWHDMDARFWATLKPGELGTLSVETPGGVRTISARFKAVDGAMQRDPFYFGWAHYGITLVADDPFWYGEPVSRAWAQPETKLFFHKVTGEQLFNINSGSVLSSASFTNAGDVEAWPVWEVEGPFTQIALGVGARQVSYVASVGAGSKFVLDSDPRDQTALVNGVDVTGDLGDYGFTPIPSGKSMPLNLSMAGTGTVHATIVPRFYRAWG